MVLVVMMISAADDPSVFAIMEKAPTTHPSLMTFASAAQYHVYLPWVNGHLA